MPATSPHASLRPRLRRLETIRTELQNERSSWESHWSELADYLQPRRYRVETSDHNKGNKRNNNILDNAGTLALRTAEAGMLQGITSPARPWLRLVVANPMMADRNDVQVWTSEYTKRMLGTLQRTNFYQEAPVVYGDMLTFATGCMFADLDEEYVLLFRSFPLGSYWLGTDEKNRVRVFYREFRLTVRQMVEKFGRMAEDSQVILNPENFSGHVQKLWKDGQLDTPLDVGHIIAPNERWDPNKADPKFKRYKSLYWERGTPSTGVENYMHFEEDRFLRESGYDIFPVLAPRWKVVGEDVYGWDSPGMQMLGDVKQLQLGEKRRMQAIEKAGNPPLNASPELHRSKISVLPGHITYSGDRAGRPGVAPVYTVDPRIQEMEIMQAQKRAQISRTAYEDLFLMLAQSDRRQITAREVEERHEEKLMALGGVLERLNWDFLDPLVEILDHAMHRAGLVPEPPEDLRGERIDVEYISILHAAQKLADLAPMERFTSFVGQTIQLTQDQAIMDVVDWDRLNKSYATAVAVDPSVVRPDEEIQAIRAARAEAEAAALQQQQTAQAAQAVRDLSESSMEGDTALSQLQAQSQAGALTPPI